MGLRYKILASERVQESLLLYHPDEEPGLTRTLSGRGHRCKVIEEGVWPARNSRADKVSTWVLTPKPFSSAEDIEKVSSVLVQAHLRGIQLVELEKFLLQIEPSVTSEPNEMIHLLASAGVHQRQWIRAYHKLKSALEPMIALWLLVLLSPLLAMVAVLIAMTSRGSIIYRQERIGLNSKPFEILKFRSMKVDAEEKGPAWASVATPDQRLTVIGGFLRSSHLDELPQLYNVVRGELGFIGPRPERPCFADQIDRLDPLFKLRALIKPGITGWAQIHQGYVNTIEDSVRKLEFDLFYIFKRSPALDLQIIMGTLGVIFSGGSEGIKRKSLDKLNLEKRDE